MVRSYAPVGPIIVPPAGANVLHKWATRGESETPAHIHSECWILLAIQRNHPAAELFKVKSARKDCAPRQSGKIR